MNKLPRAAAISAISLLCGFSSPLTHSADAADQKRDGMPSYPENLLERVRGAAAGVPGARPESIGFVKVAESHRTYSAIIEGGSEESFISARTAFEVDYPLGSIMIDSGMDETVHRFYGFGREEPYWQDQNDLVQAALRRASLILITHEHGDHVAGVLRSDFLDELAPKTMLTAGQVSTLSNRPQLPEIGLSPDDADRYLVVDYELLLPVAPGIVLIKAPGHTPGHQMIYVSLAGDAEYLFIGDIGWSLDNITDLKLRPAQTIERIGEDPDALLRQMTWIQRVMNEDNLIVIPSHDDLLLQRYVADGLLTDSF